MSPLRVGLTGGAGAGKSTVAAAFAALGVPVFSADAVSHELTAAGAPLLDDIRARFGDGMFAADGSLDRRALGERVFADAGERAWLEALLHPPIRERLAALADASDAEYCVLEIPLLKAADVGPLVDRVLLVDLPEDAQVERLVARDGRDALSARRILDAQPGRDERLALADDKLDNRHAPERVAAAVRTLDALYRDIATRGDPGRPGLHLP